MKIAIIGCGAMGSLFAARLSPLADVWMIGHWAEQIAALREGPLSLMTAKGVERVWILATNDLVAVGPVDVALILVKSHQTARAANVASKLLTAGGLALTLQNGLGNVEALSAVLGPERVTLGVTAVGATMLGPGRVRLAGLAPTHLSVRPEIAKAVEAVADLFREAGFETELTENPESLQWGKLVVNCGINALTALLRVPNGALLEIPEARGLMAEAAGEAAEVAHRLGVTLPYPDPVAQVEAVCRATATNRSSMLQDVLRGASTEVQAINGAVADEGSRLGVPTPANAFLARLVEALTTGQQLPLTKFPGAGESNQGGARAQRGV